MFCRCRVIWVCVALAASTFGVRLTIAQHNAKSTYRLPPKEVVDIISAKPAPSVRISPDRQWMLLVERDAMPSIKDLSRRMLRLAGLRIDPAANGLFQSSFIRGLKLKRLADGTQDKSSFEVSVQEGEGIGSISWSHHSNAFVFTIVSDEGTTLRVVNIAGNEVKETTLLNNLSTVIGGFSWMPDGKRILCTTVPNGRGREPSSDGAPIGPNIQESSGNKSPTRTYQDLLSNAHDEALFEFYTTTQLSLVELDGRSVEIGDQAVHSGFNPSPDGQHILRTTIRKPFSYLMTYRSFPRDIDVIDSRGNVESNVASVPLAENIPIEGVRTGPRNVIWDHSDPATLIWIEALDGGDPNKKVEHRDRIMSAGFDKEAVVELQRLENRSFGISFLSDKNQFITTEYDRDNRWIRSRLHDSRLEGPGRVLVDRSIRDRYGDPGRIVTHRDGNGKSVAIQDGQWIYRTGSGASPKGMLPFIDRQSLKTLETERLWRCSEGTYESIVGIVQSSADAKPSVITSKETPTTPANYSVLNLETGKRTKITDFSDPTPQIRSIKKRLVTYKRSDGVPLSATLYLPADYKEGTRLPLIVWAYPREFNDAKTAGQISASPSRLTRMSGSTHLTLLTQGYAIMDGATMPVIGDPKTMNDTFIDQIVDAAKAAMDKAVELGVADPNRVGIGGHSYGAFMTANLLAHSDLFNAGLARIGAYNRTLTPFGFQSERRMLWDAKSVYFGISPFLHANKIKEPLLLIHGEKDNNSGTFPMQSKRMYQAIKGNGGTVRLVMLPNESHGYRARESVLHVQAEMIEWFDRHIKRTVKPVVGSTPARK